MNFTRNVFTDVVFLENVNVGTSHLHTVFHVHVVLRREESFNSRFFVYSFPARRWYSSPIRSTVIYLNFQHQRPASRTYELAFIQQPSKAKQVRQRLQWPAHKMTIANGTKVPLRFNPRTQKTYSSPGPTDGAAHRKVGGLLPRKTASLTRPSNACVTKTCRYTSTMPLPSGPMHRPCRKRAMVPARTRYAKRASLLRKDF